MAIITLGGRAYSYTVLYRDRKTLQIKLTAADTVQVAAPRRTSRRRIDAFLRAQAGWLADRSARLRAWARSAAFRDGLSLPFRGRLLTLSIQPAGADGAKAALTGGRLIVRPAPGEQPRLLAKEWYLQQAAAILTAKTSLWSQKIGAAPRKITIKEQKTRWGSCSSLGNINYNWRIVMAPESVIDYLVIHELSHLSILDHSPRFWRRVAAYCPAYLAQRRWLKENGAALGYYLSAEK